MQVDGDRVTDPSQASGSGEGESSGVFLQGSKLWNKLEKLAQWRIDPSLIEFPQAAREFRGGYATVSQAFLASPPSVEGVTNESRHPTDDGLDSNAGNLQFQSDTQEPKNDQQSGDGGAGSCTPDGASDQTKDDRRKEPNPYEAQSHRPSSVLNLGDAASSEHTADEDPGSGDRKTQSQSGAQGFGGDQQGKAEGTDSYIVDGDNDQAKENRREESNNDPQTPVPKIVDESNPSEHAAGEDLDLSNRNPHSQSDTQEPGDDQQGKDEGTGSHAAGGDNDQTKEGARKEHDNTNEEQNPDRQTSESKIIAVKKLKIEKDADLERVLWLALRESEFLVDLSHPNIVKFEGFVEDLSANKVWLIFLWEEHGNLRDFLTSGEWEIPERISLINDVTLGLEHLHSREPPIFHGDLKSVNILVNSEFCALITDFGSARRQGNDHAGKQLKEKTIKPRPATQADPTTSEEHITLEAFFSATASTITLTGSKYTLRWAAPELLRDEEPCLQSDIWALGWIAYEVMTNTIPFHDIKKDAIVINRIIQGHLPSVTEDARMSLIRALCSLMLRCWSINPDRRPTAEECRKSISWMPMIVPATTRTIDEEASQLRYAQLRNQLGHKYRRQSDYLSALKCFTEALDIYTHNNGSKGRAETLRNLADVHRFRREYTEAITFYSEALQIYIDVGEESKRADALWGIAEARRLRHEYGEAAKLYSESLQIFTDNGRAHARATALWGLADVHRSRAEYSEAVNLYSEALQIFTDVGDQRERANTLWGLAEVHRFQNEYSEAINLYSEAVQIFIDVGDHNERANALWSLAEVHRSQQGYNEASKLYVECLQIYSTVGNRHARAIALWGLAEVHLAQHEYNEATELFSEATEIFTDFGDKHWGAECLLGLAKTHKVQDHHAEAISFYSKASEALAEIGHSERAYGASENASAISKRLGGDSEGFAETVEPEKEHVLSSE